MASRWLAIDKPLFATTVVMIGLGLLMVYSSSYHESQEKYGNGTHYLFRQAIAAVVGIVVMLLAMRIDYRLYKQRPFVLFAVGLTVALLVLVLIMGSGEGTRRWLSLGPLNLQPSEIAKLTTVLFLASYLSRKDGKINDWWNGLLPALARRNSGYQTFSTVPIAQTIFSMKLSGFSRDPLSYDSTRSID